MLHDYVATELHDSEGPLQPYELAALFVRCLIVGAVTAVTAWLVVNLWLDRLAPLLF